MEDMRAALASITADRMLEHIRTLASDEFEGRKPGTRGEDLTVKYLKNACQSFGLTGLGAGGSFYQEVPVTGYRATPAVEFRHDASTLKPAFLDDFVAMSRHPKASITDGELVFVGYGVVAPEYGWDDYKGIDVRGKILIMLIGDPRRSDPKDPNRLDDSFFRGNALTYYGRWTYKFEIASKLGAAAAFIVHDTEGAGYGFDVVRASWGGENFNLEPDADRVQAEGWLSQDTAQKLAALSGKNLDELKRQAAQASFKPVPLSATAAIKIENTARKFETRNVVATIRSDDAKLRNECIVYSAHWDHFGKKEKDGKVEGIYSGAMDNASGVAAILEIARAYHLAPAPKRSVVFLFTTLEESGLLGAQYYIHHPLIPLDKTLAIINLDVMNLWGRTKQIVSIGKGHSSLDDVLAAFAEKQGRTVTVDPEPDKGCFYRSDHLEFMRRGVPALFFLHPGADFVNKPPQFAALKRKQYLTEDYHKFSDKVKPDWDLSGLLEDAQLLFLTGMSIAQGDTHPVWRAESEFAHLRPPRVTAR
jgi:Zn-dependent M28 family amino/carboxypeptidase